MFAFLEPVQADLIEGTQQCCTMMEEKADEVHASLQVQSQNLVEGHL